MRIIILDIASESKNIIRDFIIKCALENKNSYVEMEDEILIDKDILIRINEKEQIILNEQSFKLIQPFELLENEILIEQPDYKNKQNKKELKRQSKLINNKMKNYNQRRR